MPWYNENLDLDLEDELNAMHLNNGIFLDLGTGLGTQAMELAKKGFDVIGSDISGTVIERNKIMYENQYHNIKFVVDNILYSDFKENYFDYIYLIEVVFMCFQKKIDQSIIIKLKEY